MNSTMTVALAGNPNAGKTTMFNGLTGARQHVGNYPGITVEKKEGLYDHLGIKLHVVDLPGTYSLTAYSLEEVVTRDFLVHERPEVTIDIVDASNLERNLYLALQFLELGIPVCVALNMMDVAKNRGMTINAEKLSELLGVPVIPVIARSGKGKKQLMDAAVRIAREPQERPPFEISYGEDLDTALAELEPLICQAQLLIDDYPARWTALKYLEADEQILKKGREAEPQVAAQIEKIVTRVTRHIKTTMDTYPEALIADHRYGYIHAIMKQGVLQRDNNRDRMYISDMIDKVLTNRLLGPVMMLMILMGMYQFTFTYSEVPVGWCEALFGRLGGMVDQALPDGLVKSLAISGVIDGVGGVLGFVPLIMFMFFGIAILEDTGYLARVAFMLDRIFRIFGLHGSSVMAYIISGGIAGGCAVPGVMATRTLRSPRERLATLLTAPFMNCGAKLPIMALLIAAFFAEHAALLMFILTLVAWGVALLAARLLRSTVITGESTPFVMELPPYRLPTLKGLLIHTWERTWQYIKKAGTVILGISIVVWAMMTFPGLPEEQTRQFEQQRSAARSAQPAADRELAKAAEDADLSAPAAALRTTLAGIDQKAAEDALRHSAAGRIGIALESVSTVAGFDWRTNIALVGGFAAKEVIVSTLGTAYSMGDVDPEDTGSLPDTLVAAPGWSPVTALSLIVFVMFYAPCFVAVVCIAREAGSWKWGAFSIVFNTVMAFGLSVA
ncbi:MAG: ferrous iron transport protein B, partial [Deltaproteobacteria bacterium]|nr:ferrous iron transport protein B [Deltaproteobacteria bacterium]